MSTDLLIGLFLGFGIGTSLVSIIWMAWWEWEKKQPYKPWEKP